MCRKLSGEVWLETEVLALVLGKLRFLHVNGRFRLKQMLKTASVIESFKQTTGKT